MQAARSPRRALVSGFGGVLLLIYGIAWLAPAIGLARDDGALLIAAKSLAAGHSFPRFPPLFPALLAAFTLVSLHAQWLKVLPLACVSGWLILTYNLLRKMGAGSRGALVVVGITAASPSAVFAGTNLLPETLFALLIAATLIALLNDRALPAGTFAGLATLTETAGLALIVACILILAVRGRFRSAILFACTAMVLTAPWFGWSLAHAAPGAPSNILMGLRANEKLVVLGANAISSLTTPFELLTGIRSAYAAVATLTLLGWALIRRRQPIPDLFLVFYSLTLLCLVWPPEGLMLPVLPLFLWILWRVFHKIRRQEAFIAAVLILAILTIGTDLRRLPSTLRLGEFPDSNQPPNDWSQMRKLFAWIEGNTPSDTLILADVASAFSLNTGRRSIRGFSDDGYKLWYAPGASAVTPDQLAKTIMGEGVSYVAVAPDKDFAESAAFHKSIDALERGGILEPVDVPGLDPQYRLLRTARYSFRP